MPLTIVIFADVVCPFAYVGITRLLHERDRRGVDVVARVRSWPLEVVNGVPVDPAHIAAEIDDIRAQVAPDLFSGFRVDAMPASSLPALALARAAYETGGDRIGEAVSMALRRALFEEGRDIADPDVLAGIAADHGVGVPADTDGVLADHREGRERGVVGSPHMFVGDYSAFCPVLDISKRDDGHFRVALDQAAYDDLIARALG